ncbi:MAG: aldo/keto reductase [Streptosporangiales bacterium]|nr:aldo/keto reductase [Streptosporangiales bacterium]
MEQRQLGTCGLRVSRLGLGTMTWGRDTTEEEAAGQLTAFADAGGTLLDTADWHGDGDAERVLGRLLAGTVRRSDVVIAGKAGQTHQGPDTSRGHLLDALHATLTRLGVDHLDLWQVNCFDPRTPLEETLSALDAAVTAGKVRYAGVSNFTGWQLAKAAALQRSWPGRTPIVSDQVEYSLLNRRPEGELAAAAGDAGVGLLAWSPLGRGVLTGKYRTGVPADSRAATPHFAEFVRPYGDERSRRIVESVCTAADGLGVTPTSVALCWVRDRPGVSAAIVGARTAAQLTGVLQAEEIALPREIGEALDDVSSSAPRGPEA